MAIIPAQTQIDWTNRFRVATTKLIEAQEELAALRTQWGHMDYDTAFDAASLTGTPHEGYTKQQIKAAPDATTALDAWLAGPDNLLPSLPQSTGERLDIG